MKTDLRIKHAIQQIKKVNSGNNDYHVHISKRQPLKTIITEDGPVYFRLDVKN